MGKTKEQVKEREKEVFQFIVDYKVENDGISPTLREIAKALNFSTTSLVNLYLQKLRLSGRISWSGTLSRSIQVVGGRWVYNPRIRILTDPCPGCGGTDYICAECNHWETFNLGWNDD